MEIKNIFPKDLTDYQQTHHEKDYQLIDVRQPQEYAKGHLPGARLIPLPELEGRIGDLDLDKEIIFYCASGVRSRAAATLVKDSGLFESQLYNLIGGYNSFSGFTLDEFPRMQSFVLSKDFEEILKQAMRLEKGAFNFYLTLLDRFKDSPYIAGIRHQAEFEKKHAAAIFNYGRKRFNLKEDFEHFFALCPGLTMEGGLSLKEALNRVQDHLELNCVELWDMSLEIELRAYDLYRNLAFRQGVSFEMQKMFLILSEQEKGHMRILAKTIEKCIK